MIPDSKSTYLALGDSYTIGEGVLPSERWPVLLSERLFWAPPQIIATTGWTTTELLEGIEKSKLEKTYDWVSLLIGVNNQYRGQSTDIYQNDLEILEELILPLVDHMPNRVFLLSIPDYGITPFAQNKFPEKISRELRLYNRINYAFAKENGFQYCDITPSSLLAKNDASYLAADELHPSGKMYELWVNEVLDKCHFL